MEKVNENASLGFKWLKKRGIGINKGVQFYESFMYEGVKYMLYDCVYMYNGDSQEPYIGKLTKVWELPDKTKNVKVHWFFRPKEISKWLGETKTLENEILFATGEGRGLANVNHLEAIVGLCNVVCVSKDNRNPQPSDEQLKTADYVFYRTFDVQSYAILDRMDDKVGGLEIKYIFNREKSEKTSPFFQSISYTKEENPNTVTVSETQVVPNTLKDDAKGDPQNKDIHSLLERNTKFTESGHSHDLPLKKIKSDDKCVEPGVARGFEKTTDMPSMKPMVDKAVKGEMKVGIVPVEKVENKERFLTAVGSDMLLDQPLMKLKSDDKKPPEGKHAEFEVACDSERFKEMSSKKLAVDSISKHEDKSPADVNNLKASGTSGTTEDGKKRKISAKETSDDLERKKIKKTEDDGFFMVPDSKIGINTNMGDLVAISKRKSKSGIALDILGNIKNNNYNGEGKEGQSGESKKELSMSKSLKVSGLSTDDKKNAYREFVVISKPNAETRWWFTRPPWEERLKNAYDQGTTILLHNVDPGYCSGEVEDIIWHAFNVVCNAKILQCTSVSSPHYAQALVILKTKEAAQRVLTKLDEECLMLSDGKNSFTPLVGTPCPLISTEKNSNFFGHLAVGKARYQKKHEDEAVSTSHYSQPNTIEYDMAMEWRLLQLQSMKWWEKFHEKKRFKLENLKNGLFID